MRSAYAGVFLAPCTRSRLIGEFIDLREVKQMSSGTRSEAAKVVVRRNTEEVQGGGNFDVFEELFADDFVDHTPQPNTTPDKTGVRKLYSYLRAAFPDFHAEIHWQLADGERVTTYKTYYGTHKGLFLGIAPTHRNIHFESVDVMRVHDGKITEHWGVEISCRLCNRLGRGLHRPRCSGQCNAVPCFGQGKASWITGENLFVTGGLN
jgi:predicted ester cyclase